MRLHLLGLLPLAMLAACSQNDDPTTGGSGMIDATFTADSNVTSTGAISRSSEAQAYAPDIESFGVKLAKKDGSYFKAWESVGQFDASTKFPIGDYTLQLYYGAADEEGFDKPYYYGETELTVIDSETTTPTVTAVLANTMVAINYTDAFKKYFSSYSAKIHSAGGSYIDFTQDETRVAYVRPGNISLELNLVRASGGSLTFTPASISNAKPRTFYNVTFDVNGGEVGEAVLRVIFDETTVAQPIEITLSDELLNAPEPTAEAKGYDNGATIEVFEGDSYATPLKTSINALAGLKEVTLTTTSEFLQSKGWPAELDLVAATDAQKNLLSSLGFSTTVWKNPDKMALVDFTELIKNLRATASSTSHTFVVQAKDIFTKVSETITLNVTTKKVEFTAASSGSIDYLATQVPVNVHFVGEGLTDKTVFSVTNSLGVAEKVTVARVDDLGNNDYKVTLNIPWSNTHPRINANYNGGMIEQNLQVQRNEPAYTLSVDDVDVWAKTATVRLSASSDVLAKIATYATFYLNPGSDTYVKTTNVTRDTATGDLLFTSLTPSTAYSLKASVVESASPVYSSPISFNTEADAQIPNSDMESWSKNSIGKTAVIISSNKKVYDYLPYASGETNIWWATNNERAYDYSVSRVECTSSCTVSPNSTIVNSGIYSAQIYTSGSGGGYGNTNAGPGSIIYDEAPFVGRLFIGTYHWTGNSEEVTTGHSFPSRPLAFSFWYRYQPKNTDQFRAEIEVRSGDVVIATGSFEPEATSASNTSFRKVTVALNYTNTKVKATSIYVSFYSTTKTEITRSDLNVDVSTQIGDETLKVHRGSMLYIDDISLTY